VVGALLASASAVQHQHASPRPLMPTQYTSFSHHKRKRTSCPSISTLAILICLSVQRSTAFFTPGVTSGVCGFASTTTTTCPTVRPRSLMSVKRKRSPSHFFDQRQSPDSPSPVPDDLFFAEDMFDEAQAKSADDGYYVTYDEDAQQPMDYAANDEMEDANNFFAQQSKPQKSRSSRGMDAYEAQLAAASAMASSTPLVHENVDETEVVQQPNERFEYPTPTPPPEEELLQSTEATTSAIFTDVQSESASQQPISSVDARVLESILQEGKLDLSTENQVKKLLEGPRVKDGEEGSTGGKGDGEYSSKFVSVSDAFCFCSGELLWCTVSGMSSTPYSTYSRHTRFNNSYKQQNKDYLRQHVLELSQSQS
jgi:hypothetical protein